MPKTTNDEIKNIEEKLKYIGLNISEIPKSFQSMQNIKCNLTKEYRDTIYKVFKYVDVRDIQIFITSEGKISNIEKKCKLAKPIIEYLCDETLKQDFMQMVQNMDLNKLNDLENEQNKFDISHPYSISYKDALKWRVYYSRENRKYFMIVSCIEKDNEAMFLLLKKQLQSAKDKVGIKIYIPIANENYSEMFLSNSQISEIENNLWFFTKKWPMTYEVVDLYGNRTMHIIGKTFIYQNVQSNYKILIKDKKQAIEKYELLKELFIIASNLRQEYNFNVKIDENGLLQIFLDDEEITLNNMDVFLNKQVEIKIDDSKKSTKNIDKIEKKLINVKQELEIKTEEYNIKQKQIVSFLQCKRTFLGRFKFFFKSNKKDKKICRMVKLPEIDIIEDNNDIFQVYEKKDFYYIEDLLTVARNLSKIKEKNKEKERQLIDETEKIEILNQKIKNADQFISEIESHKKSIFEFWKFTNKDLPNELTEGVEEDTVEENDTENNSTVDVEELEKLMDKTEKENLSKNEMDAIFVMKDYPCIIDLLNKKEFNKDDEKYILDILEQEKEKFNKEKNKQNIIYFDTTQNINIHIKDTKKDILKDKYKILNFDENISFDEFKNQLIKSKRILEKAYNKINTPFNISVYTILKNNKRYEWNLCNLNAEDEIENENSTNIDIIKYNVPKGSPILFYTNSIMYLENQNEKYNSLKHKHVLINLNEYELSLKSKCKERIGIQNKNYENVIKTIKIYEYDLKEK